MGRPKELHRDDGLSDSRRRDERERGRGSGGTARAFEHDSPAARARVQRRASLRYMQRRGRPEDQQHRRLAKRDRVGVPARGHIRVEKIPWKQRTH